MDDADRAEERIEQAMEDALAEVRRSQQKGIRCKGACHFCGEILPYGFLFCDVDCRDAYDYEQKIRRAQGVA